MDCKHQYIPIAWETKSKEGNARKTATNLICQFCGQIRSYQSFVDASHQQECLHCLKEWNKASGSKVEDDAVRAYFLNLIDCKMPIAEAMHQARVMFKLYAEEPKHD